MRSYLLTLWFVLLGLVLVTPAVPAANPILPKPIDGKPIPVGGLNVSLATSGYRFQEVPVLPNLQFRVNFGASVCLSNRSRAAIPFNFNDAGPRWTFRILDAADQEVWNSNSGVATPQVITEDVLGAGKSWKMSGSIPLVIEGTPLVPGTYTLQAFLNADKSVSATSFFEVVPRPGSTTGGNTGISGLVLKQVGVAGGGVEEAPAPGIRVLVANISTSVIGARQNWILTTDSEGRFSLNTPPGRYRVSAHRPVQNGPLIFTGGSPNASAEVVVEAGAVTDVTLRMVAQGIKGTVRAVNFTVILPTTQGNVITLPAPPMFQYKVRVTQIDVPPGVTPFEWSGNADASGNFEVPTPAGKFNVFGERVLAPGVTTFVAVPPATDLEVVTVAADTVATVNLFLQTQPPVVALAE
jgi:hypothetical protein